MNKMTAFHYSHILLIVFLSFCFFVENGNSRRGRNRITKYQVNITARRLRFPDFERDAMNGGRNSKNRKSAYGAKDIQFHLYTPDNMNSKRIITANDTNSFGNINPDIPLKVIVHGFTSSFEFANPFIDAYYNKSTMYNIIAVDWSLLATGPDYVNAVKNTMIVGKTAANLIEALIKENKTKLENIHLIGHSLGGETVGIIGHYLGQTVGKVARATGLDPAQPLFETADLSRRLDKHDAKFVDVIHTSRFGFFKAIGSVDFYPGFGVSQPGCDPLNPEDVLVCNHGRAHQYFVVSITHPKEYPGCHCSEVIMGVPIMQPASCSCDDSDEYTHAYMGESVKTSARGVFLVADPSIENIEYIRQNSQNKDYDED